MAEVAYINKFVLSELINRNNISLEQLAEELHNKYSTTSKDKWLRDIKEWINPESDTYPSISKAEKLAKFFVIPYGYLFYYELPPEPISKMRDYRANEKEKTIRDKFILTAFVRLAYNIVENYKYLENPTPKYFIKMFDYDEGTSVSNLSGEVADFIIKKWKHKVKVRKNKEELFKSWKSVLSEEGILIMETKNYLLNTRLVLSSDICQGFAIPDKEAPFIFVNKDMPPGQKLFTLIHELTHLLISDEGSLSTPEIALRTRAENLPKEEQICNEVAGAVLMPKQELMQKWAEISGSKNISSANDTLSAIKELSGYFGVTPTAVLYNLHNKLKIIPGKQARAIYKLLEDYRKNKEKEEKRKGGPIKIEYRIRNALVPAYVDLVINKLKTNQITTKEAASLLQMNLKTVVNLV